MEYWVRNATNADTDGLVQVIREVYEEFGMAWHPDTYHADLYDVENHYWRHGHGFWVAETLDVNPTIIGTGALHVFPPVPMGADVLEYEGIIRVGGSDCSLERMYVSPTARRMGVGQTLLSHSVAFARDKNLKRMEIWSDKLFEAAHSLYLKAGAVMVGDRLCHDPDQSPEFGMVLDLRSADI